MLHSKKNTRKNTRKPNESGDYHWPFDLGKIHPQAVDIEMNILGVCIMFPNGIEKFKSILNAEMFYKEEHQKIYQTIVDMYDDDKVIELLTLVHELKKKGLLEEVGGPYYISTLTSEVISIPTTNEKALILFEQYAKRELIRIGSELFRKSFEDGSDIFILIEMVKDQIEALETLTSFNDVKSVDAVNEALKGIDDRVKGLVIPFIKTGHDKVDEVFAFEQRTITVLAAQKGHLKSKMILDLTEGIYENNENVAICHYSMEEAASKLVRGKIAREIGIEDRVMMSKKGSLSESDHQKIIKAGNRIKERDVVHIDHTATITQIYSKFKIFCNKRPNKINILVVDNLGLVDIDGNYGEVEKDNKIAKKFVDLRDETNGVIFIIHHLNKSQMSKWNAEDGYRPRDEHLRGSSRTADFANNLIFINFIPKYKDLIQDELNKEKLIPEIKVNKSLPPFERVADIFLQINSTKDNNHKKYSYDDLKTGTLNNVRFVFTEQKLRKYFPELTIEEAADTITERYLKFVTIQKSMNASRQEKYRSKIEDPITYLQQSSFLNEPQADKESRDWYLYGDYPELYKPYLDTLLILDGSKIRDGVVDDKDVLIRFTADPGLNRFKEINNGKS